VLRWQEALAPTPCRARRQLQRPHSRLFDALSLLAVSPETLLHPCRPMWASPEQAHEPPDALPSSGVAPRAATFTQASILGSAGFIGAPSHPDPPSPRAETLPPPSPEPLILDGRHDTKHLHLHPSLGNATFPIPSSPLRIQPPKALTYGATLDLCEAVPRADSTRGARLPTPNQGLKGSPFDKPTKTTTGRGLRPCAAVVSQTLTSQNYL
jgi:hypothetical protein